MNNKDEKVVENKELERMNDLWEFLKGLAEMTELVTKDGLFYEEETGRPFLGLELDSYDICIDTPANSKETLFEVAVFVLNKYQGLKADAVYSIIIPDFQNPEQSIFKVTFYKKVG